MTLGVLIGVSVIADDMRSYAAAPPAVYELVITAATEDQQTVTLQIEWT